MGFNEIKTIYLSYRACRAILEHTTPECRWIDPKESAIIITNREGVPLFKIKVKEKE